jgi:hypothetical protein
MGCFARLGCLVLIVLLGFAAWLTRDRWTGYFHAGPPATAQAPVHWQPLTAEGVRRAQAALDTLGRVQGPVFQNVAPGDASAYVLKALFGRLPNDADSAEAAVVGHELWVRARVRVRELGGSEVLGSIATALADRERLMLAGTFHVVHPGLIEYRVTQIALGSVKVPGPMMPKVLEHLARGAHLDSVRADAVAIPTPKYLVDIRVADGHLTLYKGLP